MASSAWSQALPLPGTINTKPSAQAVSSTSASTANSTRLTQTLLAHLRVMISLTRLASLRWSRGCCGEVKPGGTEVKASDGA